MTTVNRSATASQPSQPDLMQQAAQSTANLGWLQDYTRAWQVALVMVRKIMDEQTKQARYDEEARAALADFEMVATIKCEELQTALGKLYAKHERLMIRLKLDGGDNV